MTATQSLNLYNISLRYFKNEADASAFVKEIEIVVDNKFEDKQTILATKEDLYKLSEKMSDQFKWMVGLFIPLYLSMIGLIITLLLRH